MVDSRVSLVRVNLKFTALTLQSSFLRLSGAPEADSVVRLAVYLLVWPYSLDSVSHHKLLTWRSIYAMICYFSLSFHPFWEPKVSPESPCSGLQQLLIGALLSFAVRPWQRENLSPYTQNLR